MTIFLTIPLSLVSVVGLILNLYILIIVLLTRQATSGSNILLLHLGAVNVILGILFLVFSIPGFTKTDWLSSGIPCKLHGFLFSFINPLVLWTICGLNCERYYAIAAPLHYGHIVNTKKIYVGMGFGYAITVVLCLPPFLNIAPYSYIQGLGACAPNFATVSGTLWYSSLYTAFTLLLPATLIICCNFKILMIARYHRHRIASAIFEVTLSAQVTITHQRNPFATIAPPTLPKFRGRNAIDTILQIVGSLLILYIPYYCLILWEATGTNLEQPHQSIHPYFFTAAMALLVCSPVVNGFLYGVRSKTLRKTFRNYLRKKQTKSEMIQEIQARTPSTCGSRRPSLTPLGFLTKPVIQRRLSEAFLDVSKAVNSSPQKSKIKRIASEITWRPSSANSIDLSPKEECEPKLQHTASCNTLKVPINDTDQIVDEEIYINIRPKTSPTKSMSPNMLFSKFFNGDHTEKNNKRYVAAPNAHEITPKRSPKILITRTMSEESEKNSVVNSPAKDFMSKRHSTSTSTLIERKWKMLRKKSEDSDSEGSKSCYHTTKPLLDNTSIVSTKSSESSDNNSESSTSKQYLALENKSSSLEADEANEDHLLLSWPAQKKYSKCEEVKKHRQNFLLKQTLVNMQSNELVL